MSNTVSTEGNSRFAQVAMNDSGAAILTWNTFASGNNIYVATRSTTDGSWIGPLKLTDEVEGSFSDSSRVAMNDSGAAVVSWHTFVSGDNVYVATRSTAEGSWSEPVKLSDTESTEESSSNPQVAMNNSGAAVVNWYVTTGSSPNIYASTNTLVGNIEGEVADSSSGDPVANATVELLSGSSVIVTTATNGDGEYSFEDVNPNTYTLKVSKTDYITQTKTATVSTGRVTTVDFSLVLEPGNMRGVVTDSSSGDPIANASVQGNLLGSPKIIKTKTNSSGEYSFKDLSPGLYELIVFKTNYITQTKTATVSTGRVTTVDFSLEVNVNALYKMSRTTGKIFFQN